MNTHHIEQLQINKVMSLRPDTNHVLKVVQGRAWVTLSGKLEQDNPDIFLLEGETLWVAAGQHLVLEPWPRDPQDLLWVQWQIAYDALVVPSLDQGIACPPIPPKRLPAKAI